MIREAWRSLRPAERVAVVGGGIVWALLVWVVVVVAMVVGS